VDLVCGFALLYLLAQSQGGLPPAAPPRKAHAVATQRGIDVRLEPLIPKRPSVFLGKEAQDAYAHVLDAMVELSHLPEPDRTEQIEALFLVLSMRS
jgi:hypothetical protein